jgi:hypothetical protein
MCATQFVLQLATGYDISLLIATCIVVAATQLDHRACQSELARQRHETTQTSANALLREGNVRRRIPTAFGTVLPQERVPWP